MCSHQRLLTLIHYNPYTGEFTNLKTGKLYCKAPKGQYKSITIDYVDYTAGRLAWFYMTGKWPRHVIDHINRERNDNRFRNLRDVTQKVNSRNRSVDYESLARLYRMINSRSDRHIPTTVYTCH